MPNNLQNVTDIITFHNYVCKRKTTTIYNEKCCSRLHLIKRPRHNWAVTLPLHYKRGTFDA